MPHATFIAADGTVYPVEIRNGYSLMEGARAAAVPGIRAECGGAMACATCHVHLPAEWLGVVGAPSAEEAEVLQFADGVTAASRLSCQLVMRPSLEGIVLEVPGT
jgi:2Fe-2S ferredoxin